MDFISRLLTGNRVNTITSAEAKQKLDQQPEPYLLDVRQPEEFVSGHIPGAALIPLGELPNRMSELPKDRKIIVVCQSGSRSLSASRRLVEAGYDVDNMRGGMMAWSIAGLPVKKGI